MAKKTNKTEEIKKEESKKTFYRIERLNGAWSLIEIEVNESGKVVSSKQCPEDVLPNILFQFEDKLRVEHGL